ncbi:MAG: hypothetical protein GY794_05905 [bacterium]|nr:hypothetical protein [bacterium]
MDSTDSPTSENITREITPGVQTVSLKSSSVEELFITADLRDKDLAEVTRNVMDLVGSKGATVITQTIFAPMGSDNALADSDWPVTWIDSGHKNGSPLSGMHVHAVCGATVERITLEGRAIGSVFQDDNARYCYLGDIRSNEQSSERTEQAKQTFDMMEAGLKLAGMNFSNVVRTWLYLDQLLQWYDPFNKVRDEFFRCRGVFDTLVPASTGISGANPSGAAMIAMLLAVEPLNDSMDICALPSPLQCPALKYGSSFSRAVALRLPEYTRVMVSGTASIEPGGETVYQDDVPGQVDLTMRVVDAILEQRGMTWSDVTRAIAYFKCNEYLQDYVKYCDENNIPDMPTIITENDVCRDDLLFEIEVDAIKSAS